MIKAWRLIGQVTSADIEWMKNSGLEVSFGIGFGLESMTFGEGVAQKSRATIFTQTEQEETWLLLRYADRVHCDVVVNISKPE